MRRVGLVAGGLVVVALLSPSTARAAAITQCFDPSIAGCTLVGEFTWFRDELGDFFNVNNLSLDSPWPGSFALDPLSLDLLDSSQATAPFDPDVLAAGSGLFPSAAEAFVPVDDGTPVAALLTFAFFNSTFSVGLNDTDGVLDESFAFTEIYAESVPEPSSLLLLGAGLAMARHARRRQRA